MSRQVEHYCACASDLDQRADIGKRLKTYVMPLPPSSPPTFPAFSFQKSSLSCVGLQTSLPLSNSLTYSSYVVKPSKRPLSSPTR